MSYSPLDPLRRAFIVDRHTVKNLLADLFDLEPQSVADTLGDRRYWLALVERHIIPTNPDRLSAIVVLLTWILVVSLLLTEVVPFIQHHLACRGVLGEEYRRWSEENAAEDDGVAPSTVAGQPCCANRDALAVGTVRLMPDAAAVARECAHLVTVMGYELEGRTGEDEDADRVALVPPFSQVSYRVRRGGAAAVGVNGRIVVATLAYAESLVMSKSHGAERSADFRNRKGTTSKTKGQKKLRDVLQFSGSAMDIPVVVSPAGTELPSTGSLEWSTVAAFDGLSSVVVEADGASVKKRNITEALCVGTGGSGSRNTEDDRQHVVLFVSERP